SFDENVYTKLRGLDYQLVVNNLNSLIKEARGTDLKIEVQLLRTALNSCETNNDYPIKYKNIIKYPDAEDLTINKPFTCVPNNHLELCVLWDGRLSGCCYDYNGEMIFGDITTDSLLTQWAKWSRNTNKDKNTLCKRCAYYESQ
ncbi:MAG: SPASM domain-containing protein, partial [Candidatus Nanoarchaeia archaeon]